METKTVRWGRTRIDVYTHEKPSAYGPLTLWDTTLDREDKSGPQIAKFPGVRLVRGIAGTCEVSNDTSRFTLTPGSIIWIPTGVEAIFRNVTRDPAVYVTALAPSGPECFYMDLAEIDVSNEDELAQLAAIHDVILHLPPPEIPMNSALNNAIHQIPRQGRFSL